MTKTKKKTLSLWIVALICLVSCFFGALALNRKTEAKADENETVTVTQVQFRTSGEQCYFFLRMADQTDYTTLNQWHSDTTWITDTNILDKVTVYFVNDSATLREIWTGELVGTYLWGDDHTLAFPMKSEYLSTNGIGARVDAGAEIPMIDGTKKVTTVSRTFWQNGYNNADAAINNYTEGYTAIETSVSRVHLRGGASDSHLMIGLGDGNDWADKGEALPTQVVGEDGTNTYALANWLKLYLTNFTSKIKLHVKETDTWVSYGSVLRAPESSPQWFLVFNGWGESGGIVRLKINNDYNGLTVDKVFFEKGCELPSYAFNGNNIEHTVHVLDAEYLWTSNDMSQVEALDWSCQKQYEVTFNGGNSMMLNEGETVPYPTDLSETKEEDDDARYVYNWFNGTEIYDFSQPVTSHLNLTSDGSFTAIYKKKCQLSFVNGEETIDPLTVNYGEKVGELPAVTEKAGYDGVWAIDGKAIDADYEWFIDGDATATAVYTPRQYVLSFENGEETIESITVTYGEKVGELPAVSQKANYNGVWTLNGEAINSESVWNIADNATAIAEYELVKRIVTFDGASATLVTHGDKVEKPSDPTKASDAEFEYAFEGWYLGDRKWDFASDAVEEDINLVAKFTETRRSYTITFTITGKDGLTLAPVTVEYGTTYDLTALFEDAQTEGYIYSVSVNGKDKASLKVISDVTVDVVFTPVSAEEKEGGCSGTLAASAAFAALAVGIALVCKKKED